MSFFIEQHLWRDRYGREKEKGRGAYFHKIIMDICLCLFCENNICSWCTDLRRRIRCSWSNRSSTAANLVEDFQSKVNWVPQLTIGLFGSYSLRIFSEGLLRWMDWQFTEDTLGRKSNFSWGNTRLSDLKVRIQNSGFIRFFKTDMYTMIIIWKLIQQVVIYWTRTYATFLYRNCLKNS